MAGKWWITDGMWCSLVARLPWEQEVAGSNPVIPICGINKINTRFSLYPQSSIYERYIQSGSLKNKSEVSD